MDRSPITYVTKSHKSSSLASSATGRCHALHGPLQQKTQNISLLEVQETYTVKPWPILETVQAKQKQITVEVQIFPSICYIQVWP